MPDGRLFLQLAERLGTVVDAQILQRRIQPDLVCPGSNVPADHGTQHCLADRVCRVRFLEITEGGDGLAAGDDDERVGTQGGRVIEHGVEPARVPAEGAGLVVIQAGDVERSGGAGSGAQTQAPFTGEDEIDEHRDDHRAQATDPPKRFAHHTIADLPRALPRVDIGRLTKRQQLAGDPDARRAGGRVVSSPDCSLFRLTIVASGIT